MFRKVDPLSRRRFGQTLLLLSLSGCQAALKAQVEHLSGEVASLKGQLARSREELEQYRSSSSLEINTIWGRIECSNERIRRFLNECEKGSETCSEEGLANALAFMDSQAHTTMYVSPGGPLQPVLFRKGHLGMLTDNRYLHPTTRFLVVVQPRGDGAEMDREAKKIGDETKEYLRREFRVPSGVKIIGPLALPCSLKAEQLKSYRSRNDRPRFDEPTEKEGRLRVWVFRTDC